MSVSDRLSLFMYSSTLLQYDLTVHNIFFYEPCFEWIILKKPTRWYHHRKIHHEYLLSNHSVLLINISLYIFHYFFMGV